MTHQPEFPEQLLLELPDLIEQCVNGAATAPQIARLDRLMVEDEQARKLYVRYVHTMCALRTWGEYPLVELGSSDPAGVAVPLPAEDRTHPAPSYAPVFLSSTLHGTVGFFASGWPAAYLIATVIFGIGLLVGSHVYVSQPAQVARQSVPLPSSLSPVPLVVGRITAMVDCQSVQSPESRVQGPTLDSRLSTPVSLGDKFVLASGLMEISYDTGAKVVLQGPVTYHVQSRSGGYLSLGKLTARVEKKAEVPGLRSPIPDPSLSANHYPLFTIKTPTATVTDLGTEFGIEVQEFGDTTTYVFRGAVEMRPAAHGGQGGQAVRLSENESLLVAKGKGGETSVVSCPHFDPMVFVRAEQLAKLADRQRLRGFHRWHAYRELLCRDPALVVYYDFQRRPESPGTLHAVGPGAGGTLDGVIQGEPVRNAVALLLASEANLLRGKPAEASSTYVDMRAAEHGYPALHLTDGTQTPHVFADGDVQQRLVIHGFNSAVGLIRIWRGEDRIAQQVTIKSSLFDLSSLNGADYGTTLASLSSLSFNDAGYVDIAVKAPAGTQSLFFDFGNRTEYYPSAGWPQPAGVRTMEIQAFATLPTSPAASAPPAWTRGRVPGTTALSFDNAGVKINLPRRLTQMTLAAWLTVTFIDDEYTTGGLLTSEGSGEPGGSPEKLHWQIARTGEIHFGTATNNFTTPAVLPWQTWDRNRWRHLAVVADPAHQRLACYLDGKQIHAERLPQSFAGVFGIAGIGSWQSASGRIEHGFHGRMDELLLLSRAMTDHEIVEMYQAERRTN